MKTTTTTVRSVLARTVAVLRLRKFACTALALFMLFGVSGIANAQIASTGVLLGDFNGDGIPDVLVSPSSTNPAFTLSFGAVPFGTFSSSARAVALPAGCDASSFTFGTVVGDFNHDGLADIATSCVQTQGPNEGQYSIYVLLGNGDGSFTTSAPITGSYNLLVTADFNKDRNLDLVSVGYDSDGDQVLTFFKGNGDGTFTATAGQILSSNSYQDLLAVDLDGDGYPDLVMGNFNGSNNSVDVFENNRDGTFGDAEDTLEATISIALTNYNGQSDNTVLTGNIFGSGLPDLAVAVGGGVFTIKNESTDGFLFGNATRIAVPNLVAATMGNFTSNLSDFLVEDGSTLSVLANDGTGNFTSRYAALSLPNTKANFVAADANFDGHADIYTATLTSTGVALAVNLVSGTASASSTPFALPLGSSAVSAAWPGNVNFIGSTPTGTQIVGGITPTITWPAPAAIAYGTALSTTQLDAVATTAAGVPVPGTFVYTPAAGTVLAVGTQTLNVVFTPTDLITYTVANGTVSLVVKQATTLLTWTPTVGTIVYGTPLGAAQLDATAATAAGATVAGTFVYTPGSGTVLGPGTRTLSVTFTPTDLVDYTVANGTVSLVVNQAMPSLTWTPAVNSIVYGTPLGASQLNAAATGIGGAALPGTFAYTPASGAVLAAGTQTLSVIFTPTDAIDYAAARLTTQIAVTKANPTVAWPTPAAIAYGVPLSATQLDASATGVGGAALPGAFVYTPAAGSTPNPGVQKLSVTFTPTDAVDYTTVTATVNLTITDVVFGSVTPNTVALGASATTVTITGSGIVSTTVVQVNGTAIPTTLVNPTTLTAVIPASDFLVPGTLQLTLMNPATGSVSGALSFTVSAPALSGTLNGPPTTAPGTQPTLTFNIAPYPVDVTAVLTVTLKSSIPSGLTDTKNVVFSNGSSTYTFTVKAGSTSIPDIPLAAGTVAETITVTPTLLIGTVDVTPEGLAPITIDVPESVPQAMTTTLTRSGTQLTVTIIGFSNTREIVSAAFHFMPAPGSTLTTSDFSPTVNDIFSSWYDGTTSPDFGSSFTYTQIFNVSDTAASIGSVQVTLTNSVGTSIVETAQ